ncbi:MAG TPA: MOSC domain-containing protein, partial [Pseudogracilibacillus sp.]|nr:MOSC domain-containing protein [Pseudogracilibacillus sp.]
MNTPFIKELRTGKVKQMGDKRAEDPLDREWESAIFKEERTGKVWLTKTGLEQDEVADTKVHGGPEKALFAYPVQHYAFWQQRLQIDSITAGGMGENL